MKFEAVFCAKQRRNKCFFRNLRAINFIKLYKIRNCGKPGFFEQKPQLMCMCNLHKSFPPLQFLMFDFHSTKGYDVGAKRNHRFQQSNGGDHDD